MNLRNCVGALSAFASLTVGVANAHAQRFEGIITMKLSGGIGAVMVGGRGGAARGGNDAGRGGDGRGGARAGAPARGGSDARSGAGRGAPTGNDAGAEAVRNALAGGLQQIEYMTRRGKVRIGLGATNGGAPAAAMIYVPEEALVYTVFPAMSMYAEMSMNDMTGAARVDTAAAPTGRAAPRPPVVTHTKQFELIAGHRCEHVTIVTSAMKSDVCMGKGLGVFIMPAAGRNEAWNQVMTEANGFPLKVVGNDGKVIMEVTKIERKALAESLFNVPDSYTKMPAMGQRPPG